MLPLVKFLNEEKRVILASGSESRIKIFNQIGLNPQVVVSKFPETLEKSSFATPIEYVRATCIGKMKAVFDQFPNRTSDLIVVACDTVIVRDKKKITYNKDDDDDDDDDEDDDDEDLEILEKPKSFNDAFGMIKSYLQTGKISAISAVSVIYYDGKAWEGVCFDEITELEMIGINEGTDDLIRGYLDDPNLDYRNLAGGLAIQSTGMVFVKSIKGGGYHNICGFPMARFYHEMSQIFLQ